MSDPANIERACFDAWWTALERALNERNYTKREIAHAAFASAWATQETNVAMAKVTVPIPVAAAIRTDDGVVHTMPRPHRHHHILHAMNGHEGPLIVANGEQGFLLSDGKFADRRIAGARAIRAGRIERLQHPPNLYSEDLW